MSIGTKIAKLRREKRISQPELAHILQISQTSLCDIESGKTKKVDFKIVEKICEYFDVDFEYFLDTAKQEQNIKDSAIGYMAKKQIFNSSEKLIEHLEKRIEEKDNIIKQKELEILNLKELLEKHKK